MAKKLIGIIPVSIILFFCYVYASEYNVDRDQANEVKFISDAPFEDFEGITSQIDGYVFWKDERFDENIDKAASRLYFEVELATMKTGIGMRDRDMREDYLETDKYPRAVYDAKIIAIDPLGNNSYRVTAEGDFSIHGVSQPREIIATVEMEQNDFHVVSAFTVNLKDHNIKVPKLLFLRIGEVIKIELDFHLKFIK